MISRRGFLGASIASLLLGGKTGADAPAAPEPVYSPWDSVRFASVEATAAKAAGGRKARYRRYLSLYNVPKKERKTVWAACSFLLNSLSREKRISRPSFLPDSDETVIALQLDDYAIDPDVWDKLATNGSGPTEEASPEPYFAWVATVERKVPVKRKRKTTYYQGRTWVWYEGDWHLDVPEEYEDYEVKPARELITPAPWLMLDGGAALKALQESCYTSYPILRADWFLVFASWAPLYYEFLGLGEKEADFEELVSADEKKSDRARSQVKGVVTFSTVALHNRTLTRSPTVGLTLGGYYWVSHDTLKSTDDRDYVAVLDGEKFDATENIGTLPNGLQAYFLTNGKGKRLDVAVAGIANDTETGLRDVQVYSGRNCMTCHAKGIRPIDDEARGLSDMRKKLALMILSDDQDTRKKAKDIEAKYFVNDLAGAVAFDQATFAGAIRACNGLTAAANGDVFRKIIVEYHDGKVGPEVQARDVGCELAEYLRVVKRAIGADHTIVGSIPEPPRPARRDQFERAFGELQSLLGAARKEKK